MINQNKGKSIEEFMDAAKAPLEHLFGNHAHCSDDWCLTLKAQKVGKTYTHPDRFCTHDTPEGEKMYNDLFAITNKYGSKFFLRQSMHPFNTQTNEALNHSQACLTPKSKAFHESRAFHYRHAICIGSHNWGVFKFWTQVFSHMGIPFSQSFTDHLMRVCNRRARWKKFHGEQSVKRRRAFRQNATEKRLLFENRPAEYKSGIGLDIGSGEQRDTRSRPARQRQKRTQCKCGSTTHLTSRSKECKFNKRNLLLASSICLETAESAKETANEIAGGEKFESENI